MAIPFRKYSDTKRQKEVRDLLGPKHFQRKKWTHTLTRFIAEHYMSISITVLVVACAYTHVYYYNKLTVMTQQVDNLRSQIEAGLQMRQNVVFGLTAAVNRFIDHEQGLFTSAIETRADSFDVSENLKKVIQSAKEFSKDDFSPEALTKLIAVAEAYPQLVSSQPYNLLVSKIADVESQIYAKRNEYNDAVNLYNTRLSVFPANIVGRIMCFRLQLYFTWDNDPEWAFGTDPPSPGLTSKVISTKNNSKE